MSKSFNEGAATWLTNQNEADPWDNPGGDFKSSPSSFGYIDCIPLGEVNFDVTDHVNSILDGSIENNGFIIICNDEELKRQFYFASSEHSDQSLRPKLILEYSTDITVHKPAIESGIKINQVGEKLLIFSKNKTFNKVSLLSVNGKKVFERLLSNGNFELNVSNIPAGYYLITLSDNQNKYKEKIFILN